MTSVVGRTSKGGIVLSPNQSLDASGLTELFRRALLGCQLQPGETVGVLEGPQSPPGYAAACRSAATVLGARAFSVYVPAVLRPFDEVPGCGEIYGRTGLSGLTPAVEALKSCDLVIDLIVLLHSAEQEQILRAGARMLMITEPPEVLERMFPTDDLRRRVEHSVALLGSARRLRIASDAGTDIAMDLGDFGAFGGWGFPTTPGSYGHWPNGIVGTFPNEGSAQGRWVIDRGDIILPFKTYAQNRIVVEVEDGYVTSVSGDGNDAELYLAYLHSWGDPEGLAMSHIGWGLNERALWHALAVYDRAATQGMDARCFAGNVLFSTGPNNDGGGQRSTLAHSDVPVRNCSLWLDDQQILDRGSFVPAELQLPSTDTRRSRGMVL